LLRLGASSRGITPRVLLIHIVRDTTFIIDTQSQDLSRNFPLLKCFMGTPIDIVFVDWIDATRRTVPNMDT
jgi:hypothetical protein